MEPSETRLRILRAALDEFGTRGFHATSVQAIASRVGVSKAAVLYHFETKDEILAALTTPMLDAMESALVAAELSSAKEAGLLALTGLLEVFLAHRYLMRMSLHDLALVQGVTFDRYRNAALRANVLLAGPSPDLRAKVRAAQALAMVSDPVVLYADEPTDVLREVVLEGVRGLLGILPQHEEPPNRRGRRTVMSPALAKKAHRLHAAGESPDAISSALGVSRATIYRFLRQFRH